MARGGTLHATIDEAALEQLGPVFQLHPSTDGPAVALKSRLETAQTRVKSVLRASRLALDQGDVRTARSELAALSATEQGLPEVKELLKAV